MEEKNLSALIDDFLLGKIKPADLSALNALRKSDPKIDLRVKESLKTFEFLQYMRYKELRKQLKKIDEGNQMIVKKSSAKRWIFFLLLFLFGITASVIWASHYYEASAIARRFLIEDASGIHTGTEGQNFFNEGLKSFYEKQYINALLKFQACAQLSPNDDLRVIQWNTMLTQFALTANKSQLEDELTLFQQKAKPYSNKSAELMRLIHSPLFSVFNRVINPQLSSIKPRML